MPNNQVAMNELASEIWAMEPRRLSAFLSRLANYQIQSRPDGEGEKESKVVTTMVRGGVATIPVNGILMANVPKWFSWFDIEATSYSDIVSQVKAAVSSEDVDEIRLQINSPGGTVAGVHEASEAIFAARKAKRVSAHINDLGASAAFWLGSQAHDISTGPNAEVGSIGVFSVFVDSSKAAEDEGVKVHVVRSGEHKGMGIPGAEITKEQLASEQDVVDGMADNFIKSVARGRGVKPSAIKPLATGEVWIAKTALEHGLIDSVVGAAKPDSSSKTKGSAMETDEKKEPEIDIKKIESEAGKKAVTEDRERLAALQTEFPDDLDFAVEQHIAGASLIEAKAAFCDKLKDRLVEANKVQKKAEPKKAAGAKPIGHSEGGDENAASFREQAIALAKEKNIKKSEAIKLLRKQDPDGFAAYQESL